MTPFRLAYALLGFMSCEIWYGTRVRPRRYDDTGGTRQFACHAKFATRHAKRGAYHPVPCDTMRTPCTVTRVLYP